MSVPPRYVFHDPHKATKPHAAPIPQCKWDDFRPFLQLQRSQGRTALEIVSLLKQRRETIQADFAPTLPQLNGQFSRWKREEDGRSEAATPRPTTNIKATPNPTYKHDSIRARTFTAIEKPTGVSLPTTTRSDTIAAVHGSVFENIGAPTVIGDPSMLPPDQKISPRTAATGHDVAFMSLDSTSNLNFFTTEFCMDQDQSHSSSYDINGLSPHQYNDDTSWFGHEPTTPSFDHHAEPDFFEDADSHRYCHNSLAAPLTECLGTDGPTCVDEEPFSPSMEVDDEAALLESTDRSVLRRNSLPASLTDSLSKMSISADFLRPDSEVGSSRARYLPLLSGSYANLGGGGSRSTKSKVQELVTSRESKVPARLSHVAKEFVKLKSENLGLCWPYLQCNRELLNEPPEAFLSAAAEATHRGRSETARDYVDCLNLISAYHILADWVFEPFLMDLVAGNGVPPFDSRQRNTAAIFMSSSDRIVAQLRQSQDTSQPSAGMSRSAYVDSLAAAPPVRVHGIQTHWTQMSPSAGVGATETLGVLRESAVGWEVPA